MKKILLLILLLVFCVVLWNSTLILWDSKQIDFLALEFFWFFIAFFIFISIIFVDKKFHFLKHVIGYPVLLYYYTFYIFIYVSGRLEYLIIYPFDFLADSIIFLIFKIGFYASFPFVTLFMAILMAMFEKKELTEQNKRVLFFSSFIILIMGFLITCLIYLVYNFFFFELMPARPFNGNIYTDPEIWAGSGGLEFAYIFYFGVYYLWLKEKLN